MNALNEKTSNDYDQDTEKSNPDRESIRRRSVVYGSIAAVAMATGFIVSFTSTYEGIGVNMDTFGKVLIVISIALFMRASRLRNEYYLGISSKGWSGMPTDKDLAEALKRVGVGKGMNAGSSAKEAERDAELVELRREMKELRSQLKANSQAGRERGEDQ